METNVNNSNFRGCRTSALETVKRCPFAVQKVYRDKVCGYIATSALRGSAVHDALEDYAKHCLENTSATDYDYWKSIIFKYAANVPAIVFQETLDILMDCSEGVNFNYFFNGAKEVHIEERFYLDKNLQYYVPEPGTEEQAHFSSAIDTYIIHEDDETATVSDYKTSRKIFSNTVLKTKLQKDYYPFLIFQKYPNIQTVHFYFDFVRNKVISDPITLTRENDWERLRAKLDADIEHYYEVINDPHDREARPSGFCQLCGILGICPAARNAMSEDVIITDVITATSAVRQLRALQLKIKQISENVGVYLNSHPNLVISETEGYGLQKENKESVTDLYHLHEELKTQTQLPGAFYDAIKLSKAQYLKLIKNTSIAKDKYLVSKARNKTGFYDLEAEEEEEESED